MPGHMDKKDKKEASVVWPAVGTSVPISVGKNSTPTSSKTSQLQVTKVLETTERSKKE